MIDDGSERIPSKVYIIVNKCENLPDLRTEKEKKRFKKTSWQVIFSDVKENLTTGLIEGESEVCWMCECFLTLKSTNSFSMIVEDDKSRKAGIASISLNDIPPGDNQLLKPGRLNEGAREAYRNLQPIRKQNLLSTNTQISFWIWAIEYRRDKTNSSNLGKLKMLSKSATNLFKNSSPRNSFRIGSKHSKKTDFNPFEFDYADIGRTKPSNPFENSSEFHGTFQDKFGNSTFSKTEHPKFRPSIWIPSNTDKSNPFSGLSRASSLPGIDEISKNLHLYDYSENLEAFKETLNQRISINVTESELGNFKTLSDIYRNKNEGYANKELENAMDEEFFAVLNNTKRQFAINIIKYKSTELQNKELNEEISDLRKKFYLLKTKLITSDMSEFLQDLYKI